MVENLNLPELDYYLSPLILNELEKKGYDMQLANKNGDSYIEDLWNTGWNPIDSFRLQCLDISWHIMDKPEHFEKYASFFVRMYLHILKTEKNDPPPCREEIENFYKEFMEAFFRGLGCDKSHVDLTTHRILCFRYLLQSIVENQLTVERSLLNIDLISFTENQTKGQLEMMLNDKTKMNLFDIVSELPKELREPEILAKIKLLVDEGFLDNLGKPSRSVTYPELAVIAEMLCRRFNIRGNRKTDNVNWSLFEKYWNIKNLRQYAYHQSETNPDKQNVNIRKIEKIINS